MKISKKKNILAIVGSNNANGITKQVINLIKKNLIARNENLNFQIFDTTQLNIKICQGCNTCFDKGYCPLDKTDDMNNLKEMLENADIVILACPVYLLHVSSPMKIILDRLSYWCHLLKLRKKLLITVVTTSRSGSTLTNEYLKYIGIGLGMLPISEIIFEHNDNIDELIKKINKCAYIANMYLIGKKQIHSNKFLEETFNLEKNDKLQQLDSSFEKKYWKTTGLLDCSSFEEVLVLEEKIRRDKNG